MTSLGVIGKVKGMTMLYIWSWWNRSAMLLLYNIAYMNDL